MSEKLLFPDHDPEGFCDACETAWACDVEYPECYIKRIKQRVEELESLQDDAKLGKLVKGLRDGWGILRSWWYDSNGQTEPVWLIRDADDNEIMNTDLLAALREALDAE